MRAGPQPQCRGRVAVPGGVHAAAAPRSPHSGSCRRTCPPGRGEADNGVAVEGSARRPADFRSTWLSGPQGGSVSGEIRSPPAGQWDLPGPRSTRFYENLVQEGGASEAQTWKPRLLLRGNEVGSSGARSGSRLGMIRRPDLEAKPPGEELCNTPFQSLAF